MCTLQYFNISVCAYGNANTNRRRTEILDTKKFSRKFSKKKKIQENFRHKKIFRHMRKNYFPKNKIFSVFLCLFCYRRNLVFNFVAKNKFVVFFIWWLFFFFFLFQKKRSTRSIPAKPQPVIVSTVQPPATSKRKPNLLSRGYVYRSMGWPKANFFHVCVWVFFFVVDIFVAWNFAG